jgi:hypothetical protein
MQPAALCDSFNRYDLAALALDSEHQAGSHDPAIEQYCARTAVPVITALLCAGKR